METDSLLAPSPLNGGSDDDNRRQALLQRYEHLSQSCLSMFCCGVLKVVNAEYYGIFLLTGMSFDALFTLFAH